LAKDAVQLYEQSLIIKVRQTFTTSALFNRHALETINNLMDTPAALIRVPTGARN
jgi:hypothetical protein